MTMAGTGLLLSDDLLFSSRIIGTARSLGHQYEDRAQRDGITGFRCRYSAGVRLT